MKVICGLLLLLLTILPNSALFAEVIKHIEISGNSKTKKASILRWGRIELGADVTEEELALIIEKLKRAYQFNLKSISFRDNTLYIHIEDKWSLFPVPMLTQSGDYYSRGILLYDNNFLGRLGTFVPGIFWTNSGLNGIVYFQEDNILSDSIGMKMLFLHKSDLTQFKRQSEVTERFETRFDTVILTPNFNRGRHDHKLGPIYIKKKILKLSAVPVFESERLGLYYRNHYNNFIKLPVLFDGLETSYDFFLLPDKKGHYDYLHGGDIQYCLPNGNNFHRLQIHFHHTNNSGYISPKMLGGNEGHRGYDRESFPVQRNLGFMLQEQIQLWPMVYGSPFFEFNSSKLIRPVLDGKKLNESTLGMNLSYYFEKISIPAVIIELARNLDDKSTHIHLNVGLKL